MPESIAFCSPIHRAKHELQIVTTVRYDTRSNVIGVAERKMDETYYDFTTGAIYNELGYMTDEHYRVLFQTNTNDSGTFEEWKYGYTYGNQGELTSVSIDFNNTSGAISYVYDDLDRLSSKNITVSSGANSFTNNITYSYKETGSGSSYLVNTYTSTVNNGTPVTYTYT